MTSFVFTNVSCHLKFGVTLFTVDPVKLVNATQDQRIRWGPNAATNLTCLFRGRNISNITWNKKDDQGLEDIRLPARCLPTLTDSASSRIANITHRPTTS